MQTRLLTIIGIITMPLVFPHGFSQCIYNDDWPDAPCFDTGPVNHSEFNKAWAPYHDHKGSEWMETKRIEMNQASEQGIVEEWVEKLENHNVYRYYLSRNEIQSQLPYDGMFVTLDPNFVNPEPTEPVLTREQLADALILCIEGYKQVGPECVPDDIFTISYAHQWILKIVLMLLVLIVISVGIIAGVKVWRKRK